MSENEDPSSGQDEKSLDEKIQNRRSVVRVSISILAMLFVFGGGSGMIAFLLFVEKDVDAAFNLFNIVFPVATGVIGYWFAEQSGFSGSNKNR